MIQAKSLSNVVELADNPPASLHVDIANPDPLILYIARVPGSQDVFLTTAKPLQKVVTAQDVQSSLYYIHVDSQDDERLRENSTSFLTGDHGLEVTESCGISNIDGRSINDREAFRDRSHYTIISQQGVSLDSHCAPSPDNPQNIAQIVRKPVASHVQQGVESSPTKPEPPSARIIGPRAMVQRIQPVNSPDTGSAYGKENLASKKRSEQPAAARSLSPAKPQTFESSTRFNHSRMVDPISNDTSYEPPSIGSERTYNGKSDEPGSMLTLKDDCPSLTLIRRYDGSQKNVVSELRFNLPSSSTTGVASPRMLRSPDRPTTAKRTPYFSSRHKSESSVGEDHTQRLPIEDPMNSPNLSLGREKAGGGFGGKQAKLGKLIVEAEGLKMLDLVVAANMGVWWKAYEKSA
ncbi:MAG: hypothetical protein Q9212_002301 [Teloschistes hypoglaucus]